MGQSRKPGWRALAPHPPVSARRAITCLWESAGARRDLRGDGAYRVHPVAGFGSLIRATLGRCAPQADLQHQSWADCLPPPPSCSGFDTNAQPSTVIPGLVPGIHRAVTPAAEQFLEWIAGTSPAMTKCISASGRASRRDSRRSRDWSCGRASRPRHISPAAGRAGISNPRAPHRAPA